MALKLRPTGLGSGINKDRPDYTVVTGEWERRSPRAGRVAPSRASPLSRLALRNCGLSAPKHGHEYGQDWPCRYFSNDFSLTARIASPPQPYFSGSFSFQMIAP